MTKFRRLACVCLTAVMGVSLAASNTLAFANDTQSGETGVIDRVDFENVTGKMDLSAIAINNLSPSVLENANLTTSSVSANSVYTVIVELSGESIIDITDSAETVPDYLSTYSGSRKLKSIRQSQENLLARLSSLGIAYKFVDSFATVTNAVALQINSSDFKSLAAVPGVKNVILSSTYAFPEAVEVKSLDVTDNPSNVYGTGIYNSAEIIEKYGVDGSGMTVAILDTGLDYTHEAFLNDPDEDTLGLTKDDVAALLASKNFDSDLLYTNGGKKLTADDVYISAKVPFAYDYADGDTDVYPSYSVHGTHVAGIVAGEADSYIDKNGQMPKDENGDPVPFRGVAPKAQLVICKVFTDDFDSEDLGGAVTEDILAALDDCVNLGVDVINMSLGSSAGFSSIVIDDEVKGLDDTEGKWMNAVYDSIKDRGISLICAASNEYSSGYGSVFGTNLASNPDSGTVGSPSTFNGAMSVASINGQLARYMTVETTENGQNVTKPIYYLESSDENSIQYDFLDQMSKLLGGVNYTKVKYVIIPGRGEAADYTTLIQRELKDKTDGPVIAVIQRGKTTFKEKIQIAMEMGADAAILANNVAGTIRMSIGDIDDPIPAVSVTMDAGTILSSAAKSNVGYVTLDESFQAGPFMNDYSSWGTTPDLKLKPDITAHGGEITSTVPGGYDEQSGTSMASPNLAGFVALLRSYLKQQDNFKNYTPVQLTTLVNQILMSSAIIVYDQEILPYSPRKQGAGLASLDNAFGTNAFLYTVNGAEDGRPKVELGEDKNKNGEYVIEFYINNFGTKDLTFTLNSLFMTETLSSDGLSVAEKAHMFGDIPAKWTVGATSYNEGDTITVKAGESAVKVSVTLTLSDAEKRYIDTCFINGMFVEGFINLKSGTADQCDLSLPFMGFYGDWSAAPMLDYNAYEISDFQQDTSLSDEERPQAQVWATQAYARYYNGRYNVPMGGFAYIQDENADQIYVEEEYAAVSRYNDYYGETGESDDARYNYMTTYGIRALYAGLLRNAEVISYSLYNDVTGEFIKQDYIYRVSKAVSAAGAAIPANVKLDLSPEELGLVSNGKYRLDFYFYFDADDVGDESKINDGNTFSMTFYVDYEAPVLTDARIRYYDYKDGTKDKQRVYLDLDIYDNHYAQSVILCYINESKPDELVMATRYVTPVMNAVKNGVTTVSIEVTEFYEKYKDSLYIQIDDYALNHAVYYLRLSSTASATLPSDFDFADGSAVTIGVNECYKLNLNYEGTASLSDFTWGATNSRVKIKNGEVFGVSEGTSTVTVSNGTVSKRITVTVVNKNITLPLPDISFGLIETAGDGLHNAVGAVKVYAGQTYTLEVIPDPWYYPIDQLELVWDTTNKDIATVDQNGVVVTGGEEGSATISAVIGGSLHAATVTLLVQDPFTISNYAVTKYNGPGGTVKIPDDKNITYIGEDAFKDNTDIEYVIIPKTVVEIRKRAFQGCTNLKAIYFISDEPLAADDYTKSKLSIVLEGAFKNCTSLELIDLTNVKVVTLGRSACEGCTSLTTVKNMGAIGTLNARAFYGCTALESADITGVHTAGSEVFANCTNISSITTGYYSDIGVGMFRGCTALTGTVVINTANVSASAFEGCTAITAVDFGGNSNKTLTFSIGDYAFYKCDLLESVTFGNHKLSSLGDQAFAECPKLQSITLPDGDITYGDQVFYNTPVNNVAVKNGTKLIFAPKIITDLSFLDGVTEIGDYAFSDSVLSGITALTIPDSVTKIGEGAFAHFTAQSIVLPDAITAIPDYAFYGCSNLSSFTVPREVKTIGTSAFEGCINLAQLSFAGNPVQIDDGAFAYCQKLVSVAIPSSVTVMGNEVFYGCHALEEVSLPALKSLGSYTFNECTSLRSVTFDANATTIGTYTFFAGGDYDYTTGAFLPYESKLASVTLPDSLTTIGEGVFSYCNALTAIDLKNVTSVDSLAFANCTALATVTGLERLTYIGDGAFALCTKLVGAISLAEARYVGSNAFYSSGATSVKLPKAENIGAFAFYGSNIVSLELPATLKTYGEGAFAGSPYLRTITVDAANETFFSADGVLYRNINGGSDNSYELTAYPAAKVLQSYTVADGTVAINAYAFAFINGNVQSVVLPHSLQTIGAAAFYQSGITEYIFNTVTAPTLLTEAVDYSYYANYFVQTVSSTNTLFYENFENDLILFSPLIDAAYRSSSELKIVYPVNATGFDNYVYKMAFGTAETGDEVMDDTTRGVKDILDNALATYGNDIINVIKGWNSIADNAANKAMVQKFSDDIKEAHRLYNNIAGETQLQLLDEGKEENYYYSLLVSIESELKTVKAKFGIAVTATALRISADSSHRTQYSVGEKFDMTGLKLTVVYDDYSTEDADMSLITLSELYTDPLEEYNRYVVVQGYGRTVQIAITVTDDGNGGTGGGNESKSGCKGGCGATGFGGSGGTGLLTLGILALALTGAVAVKRRRQNKSH